MIGSCFSLWFVYTEILLHIFNLQIDSKVQLMFIITCALVTVETLDGGARHIYYLSPEQLSTALKYNWTSDAFAIVAFGTGKISTALLMLRIMGPTTVWRKWFLYICMAFTLIFTFLSVLFTFIQCNPPKALWEKSQDPSAGTQASILITKYSTGVRSSLKPPCSRKSIDVSF